MFKNMWILKILLLCFVVSSSLAIIVADPILPDITLTNQTGPMLLLNYTVTPEFPPDVPFNITVNYVFSNGVNGSFIGTYNNESMVLIAPPGANNVTFSAENWTKTISFVNYYYDLSLRNEPAGPAVIGTWIKSIATAVGGTPLNTDYCKFKITSPSNNVSWSGNITFGDNDWVDYSWQLTQKGTYLVEVWAFNQNGTNVPAPPTPPILRAGNNVFMSSVHYNVADEAIASQIITVT